jgi:hypothetical protein
VFGVLIDRLAKFGGAVVKFFKGDFKGAWEDAKDSVGGLGDEILDVAKKADKVALDEFANKEKLIKREKEIAKLLEANGELRRKARDITKFSAKDRAEFAKQELANLKVVNKLKLQTLDEEIQLLKDRQALGNNTLDDDRELSQLILARGKEQKQLLLQEKELLMLKDSIGKEAVNAWNKEKKAIQEAQEELKKLNDIKAQGTGGDGVEPIGVAEVEAYVDRLKIALDEKQQMLDEDFAKMQERLSGGAKIFDNMFSGMQNIISQSLQSTENVFKAFGNFFANFIKGMLIKVAALTIAMLALTAVMAIAGLGGGKFASAISTIGQAKGFGTSFIDNLKNVAGFANGGITDGGLTMVGERGREIVNLPKGSRVHSAADTKQMLSGASNGSGTVNLTVNGFVGNQAQLAREISVLLDNQKSNTTRTSYL